MSEAPRKKRWPTFFLIAWCLVASETGHSASPGVSGTLSIIPGLGQVANGNTLEGLGWFATTIGLVSLRNPVARKFGQNIWFYNMYDAYRDAGAQRATKHNALVNYAASYNPLNAFDLIGAPIVGVAALTPGNTAANKGTPTNKVARAFYYTAVGFGEEGLFRGFLFPAFSTGLGSTAGGALLSSAVFSAVHGQGGFAFVSRFVGGLLFCWQAHRNKYDLRPSIFAHTWFDFFLTRNGNVQADIDYSVILKHEFRF